MDKEAILLLLQKLLRDAAMSDCNSRYYVDQEQLLKNIEHELETLTIPCPNSECRGGMVDVAEHPRDRNWQKCTMCNGTMLIKKACNLRQARGT